MTEKTLGTYFFVAGTAATAGALTFLFFAYKRAWEREIADDELNKAESVAKNLKLKLLSLESIGAGSKKEVRVWMDGAFDMTHYGHMNAFRQGRSLGTTLIVGVNCDKTITECKGKPVTNEEERLEMVRCCRFVDEVVPGVPYIMNDEYLHEIIEKYNLDYIVHGDDPCIVNGRDVYESAQKIGKYLTIPRTEGISTTDIVGRMLQIPSRGSVTCRLSSSSSAEDPRLAAFHQQTDFLTTARFIQLFGAGIKPPKATDKIVYVAGSWDMFHAGHASILQKAHTFGDYVIVGVYNDATSNRLLGPSMPILTTNERVLSILGCKYADDVLIDAPFSITREMIASMKISVVLSTDIDPVPAEVLPIDNDPLTVPKQMGIVASIKPSFTVTVFDMLERIQSQMEKFTKKFISKKTQEDQYYAQRYQLSK